MNKTEEKINEWAEKLLKLQKEKPWVASWFHNKFSPSVLFPFEQMDLLEYLEDYNREKIMNYIKINYEENSETVFPKDVISEIKHRLLNLTSKEISEKFLNLRNMNSSSNSIEQLSFAFQEKPLTQEEKLMVFQLLFEFKFGGKDNIKSISKVQESFTNDDGSKCSFTALKVELEDPTLYIDIPENRFLYRSFESNDKNSVVAESEFLPRPFVRDLRFLTPFDEFGGGIPNFQNLGPGNEDRPNERIIFFDYNTRLFYLTPDKNEIADYICAKHIEDSSKINSWSINALCKDIRSKCPKITFQQGLNDLREHSYFNQEIDTLIWEKYKEIKAEKPEQNPSSGLDLIRERKKVLEGIKNSVGILIKKKVEELEALEVLSQKQQAVNSKSEWEKTGIPTTSPVVFAQFSKSEWEKTGAIPRNQGIRNKKVLNQILEDSLKKLHNPGFRTNVIDVINDMTSKPEWIKLQNQVLEDQFDELQKQKQAIEEPFDELQKQKQAIEEPFDELQKQKQAIEEQIAKLQKQKQAIEAQRIINKELRNQNKKEPLQNQAERAEQEQEQHELERKEKKKSKKASRPLCTTI